MDLAPLLTFGGAVITAILTVIGTIYVARSRTRADLGASITTGFRELTDQLQEERNQLSEIIKRQRDELNSAESNLRRMRRQVAILEEKLEAAQRGRDPPPP